MQCWVLEVAEAHEQVSRDAELGCGGRPRWRIRLASHTAERSVPSKGQELVWALRSSSGEKFQCDQAGSPIGCKGNILNADMEAL